MIPPTRIRLWVIFDWNGAIGHRPARLLRPLRTCKVWILTRAGGLSFGSDRRAAYIATPRQSALMLLACGGRSQ